MLPKNHIEKRFDPRPTTYRDAINLISAQWHLDVERLRCAAPADTLSGSQSQVMYATKTKPTGWNMSEFIGIAKDRRGVVVRNGKQVRAWHYRIMKSQPMIQRTKVRHGTLNGIACEFLVTQDPGRTRRAYAYFWWGGELLFFQTGTALMDTGEAITYADAKLPGNSHSTKVECLAP